LNRLDDISVRLLQLDIERHKVDLEYAALREETLELLEEGDGKHYSDASGYELVAQRRAGRVNAEALKVVAGPEAWEQVSVATRVLDNDLLRSAIRRKLIAEEVVAQCREQGVTALIHRKASKPILTTA
jgi:hypothetical protein